jgi:hypothetical protein
VKPNVKKQLETLEEIYNSKPNSDSDLLGKYLWFQSQLKGTITTFAELKLTLEAHKRPQMGYMYFFNYMPLNKDLNVYDKYPLIFPILPKISDGFYGLNLHYLPPRVRAYFLFRLITEFGEGIDDENYRVMTYRKILKQKKLWHYKYTIKHYKYKQMKSPLYIIPTSHWHSIPFLPFQKFIGATSKEVWSDKNKI